MRGYDSHLIMESIGKYKNADPKCIANNMEKYISISIGNLRFIDSFQIMPTSLAELVENLSQEGVDKFNILKKHYLDPTQLALLMKKGVYPYEILRNKTPP